MSDAPQVARWQAPRFRSLGAALAVGWGCPVQCTKGAVPSRSGHFLGGGLHPWGTGGGGQEAAKARSHLAVSLSLFLSLKENKNIKNKNESGVNHRRWNWGFSPFDQEVEPPAWGGSCRIREAQGHRWLPSRLLSFPRPSRPGALAAPLTI